MAFLGLKPWEARRMEPREVWALIDAERRRWSRTTELVAWVVWQITMSMPMTKHKAADGYFSNWLKRNMPPGFIQPKKEEA